MAVYSCPKAFSGNYQLLIRRVFGKLTTGKVTVEVITHYNTEKAKTFEQKIPLDSGEALVKFDVADGRRKESIQEQQVVNAAVAAVAQVNLARHPDSGPAARRRKRSTGGGGLGCGPTGRGGRIGRSVAADQSARPFPPPWANGLHGAVGYTPVIITLPEGTNLAATGVVSADRRYVRITTVPLFSAVSAVHTFNIGGATETPAAVVEWVWQGGGMGGGGMGGMGGGGMGGMGGGGMGGMGGGGMGGMGGGMGGMGGGMGGMGGGMGGMGGGMGGMGMGGGFF